MEDVIQCLGIDVQDEPYLIRRVKNAVEDSYFRMKHEGARFITIDNVINVQTLIVQLELDRVKFLRKISPSGLLYCIECETALADVLEQFFFSSIYYLMKLVLNSRRAPFRCRSSSS